MPKYALWKAQSIWMVELFLNLGHKVQNSRKGPKSAAAATSWIRIRITLRAWQQSSTSHLESFLLLVDVQNPELRTATHLPIEPVCRPKPSSPTIILPNSKFSHLTRAVNRQPGFRPEWLVELSILYCIANSIKHCNTVCLLR